MTIGTADLVAGAARVLLEAGLCGGRVVDGARADTLHPYISVGPYQATPESPTGIEGRVVRLQLDVWSRHRGKAEAADILDLVVRHLDGVRLAVSPGSSALATVDDTRVFQDPDGTTIHGVASLRLSLQTVR